MTHSGIWSVDLLATECLTPAAARVLVERLGLELSQAVKRLKTGGRAATDLTLVEARCLGESLRNAGIAALETRL